MAVGIAGVGSRSGRDVVIGIVVYPRHGTLNPDGAIFTLEGLPWKHGFLISRADEYTPFQFVQLFLDGINLWYMTTGRYDHNGPFYSGYKKFVSLIDMLFELVLAGGL